MVGEVILVQSLLHLSYQQPHNGNTSSIPLMTFKYSINLYSSSKMLLIDVDMHENNLNSIIIRSGSG